MPLAEEAQAFRVTLGEGTRQFSPVPLEYGVPQVFQLSGGPEVAVTRGARLFNTNTADCEGESLRTVGESCPVAVC